MYSLGLSAAEQRSYQDLLVSSHNIDIRVQVLNLDMEVESDVSNFLLDGQVNVDAAADVTRSCSLELYDPNHNIALDSNSPLDGAMYLDRMIRVTYIVYNPNTLERYSIPIFTGPITKLDRTNTVINVECMGKETLAKRPSFKTKTYNKNLFRRNIIKEAMQSVGERWFDFFNWDLRSTGTYSLVREGDVWAFAKSLSGGHAFFYDGYGRLVLRPKRKGSMFTFKTGNKGSITTTPQVNYTSDNISNTVLVKGGVPKGKKEAVEYTASAPSNHPLSPASLRRGGEPGIILSVIEDTDIVKTEDAKARAERALNSALLQNVAVTFDCVPIPHLEPGDVVRVETDDFGANVIAEKFTIPLKAGASMSFGYNARRAVNKKKIRKKR